MPEIQLTQGTLNYRDEGQGPAVVFIHGLLVNGRVWDDVTALLGSDVAPDRARPAVGIAHDPDEPRRDLDPPALAA